MPPVPSMSCSEPPSALSSSVVAAASSPTVSVASHAVTCSSRLCPALAAAPVRLGAHGQGRRRQVRAGTCPRGIAIARILYWRSL